MYVQILQNLIFSFFFFWGQQFKTTLHKDIAENPGSTVQPLIPNKIHKELANLSNLYIKIKTKFW